MISEILGNLRDGFDVIFPGYDKEGLREELAFVRRLIQRVACATNAGEF
jgi:hypothetical protein